MPPRIQPRAEPLEQQGDEAVSEEKVKDLSPSLNSVTRETNQLLEVRTANDVAVSDVMAVVSIIIVCHEKKRRKKDKNRRAFKTVSLSESNLGSINVVLTFESVDETLVCW